ncbi:MAG: ureidoglycolate lyase [Spongiibacteraceae bacterium]|nr:ureidoglycolate lyase [Spongiibacteraceae bacterium]
MNILVEATRLTAEAFLPFGDVIEVSDKNQQVTINRGSCVRHHNLASIDTAEQGGSTLVNIFCAKAAQLPHKVTVMERHPLSSQAFVPLGTQRYLVVVGKKGRFDACSLSAFIAQAGQGVNYHRGVWHHFCLPLDETMNFLVIDRAGAGNNCDEFIIPQSLTLSIVEAGIDE